MVTLFLDFFFFFLVRKFKLESGCIKDCFHYLFLRYFCTSVFQNRCIYPCRLNMLFGKFEKVQICCSWSLKFTVFSAFPTAENMPLLKGIGHKNTEHIWHIFTPFDCFSIFKHLLSSRLNGFFCLSSIIKKKKKSKELKKLKERKKICYIS